MRTILLALILATVTLAGCSETAPPVEEDPTFEAFDDTIDADLGIIRGVVVDTAIIPIADVAITIAGRGDTTTTNEDGAFQFTDLEPGTYFLEVNKVGFEETQTNADVVAGEVPSILRIQLQPNPAELPTAVTLQAAGHTGCSFLFGITSLRWACDDVDPPLHARFDVGTPVPDALQAEMIWDATQRAGNGGRLFVAVVDGPDYGHNFV